MRKYILKVFIIFSLIFIFSLNSVLVHAEPATDNTENTEAVETEEQQTEEVESQEETVTTPEEEAEENPEEGVNDNSDIYTEETVSPSGQVQSSTVDDSITGVTSVNGLPEANLELNNILNIILIAIGVLLILFSIALLIRIGK